MYGSKHRATDGLCESRKDGSGYASTKREHETNDDSSNPRKYIRTQSSSNNRPIPTSSSSQQQRQNGDKDKKTVKDTKKPLRVFGDWSEFKSSTGKTYFYNSKTEISQWEKPKGWPTDEPSTSTDRNKKSTNVPSTTPLRSRYKMENPSPQPHSNGDIHSKKPTQDSTEISSNRLPSPTDETSRMSFSSTSSSKESSTVMNSERNDNNLHTTVSISDNSISSNGTIINRTNTLGDNENSITKLEREQEIQKYYRADLIQHLTDWSSTQLEKQCLKLFDDYYNYSAKMSNAFVDLKGLKSNYRVLDIKRNILTQRLLRCQQYAKEREDDKLL